MQGLYAIVDMPHPHGLAAAEVTQAVLAERLEGGRLGASVVQLRAKEATTAERVAMLRTMGPLCERAGVPLFVNDDIEAALAGVPGVTGVHLGRDDEGARDVSALRARARAVGLFELRVGLSTHDLRQLREAGRRAPDLLAFGPVCATGSKRNPDPVVGLDGLLDACRLAMRPLVAIGGLDEETGCRAIEAGAAAVAIIGALVDRTVESIAARSCRLAGAFEQAAAPLPFAEVQRRVPVLSTEQLVDLARFSNDVGMHIELGLPARFRPGFSDGEPQYRSSDVLDVLHALNKRPDESWEAWRERTGSHVEPGPVVQIRHR